MPRRRACTTAAVATLAVATAPTCSHALVAPRHSMMSRARADRADDGIAGRRRCGGAAAATTTRTTTTRRRTEEEDEDDDAHLFDDEEDEGAVSDADFEGDSLKARARKPGPRRRP